MLQLRVRLLNDDTSQGNSSRILQTQTITHTDALNVSATLDFTVDRATFTPTVSPFVVGVEYSIDGAPYLPLPKSDTFIVEEIEDDSAQVTNIATYRGVEYAIWLLAGAYVGEGINQTERERTVNGDGNHYSNPSQIMRYFIAESQSRGWLPNLGITSNNTVDSKGNAWTADDKVKVFWQLETFYDAVLNQLVELGVCEWTTQRNQLHLHRTGTVGEDRSNRVIGGPGYKSMRVAEDYKGWYTHVLGLYEPAEDSGQSGRYHNNKPEWEARFGRRSSVLSQSGIKDLAEAQKQVNQHLAKGNTVQREEIYTWTPTKDLLTPFRDIVNGDSITTKARGANTVRRIMGTTVIQDMGTNHGYAEVQVRVGDRVVGDRAKNQKILNSITGGATIGGSGNMVATTPPPLGVKPRSPEGLHVNSNEASWLSNDIPHVAVEIEWSAVTNGIPDDPALNPTGPEVIIKQYEVWSRTASGPLTLDAAVEPTTNTATITTWTPGELRFVTVRAQTDRGRWSDYAAEVAVTTAYPDSLVPKAPASLTLTSTTPRWGETGPENVIVLDWPDVTKSVDDANIVVQTYEIWEDGAVRQTVTASNATLTLPYKETRVFTVRAVTKQGFVSDPSPSRTVSNQFPAVSTLAPSTPTVTSQLASVSVRWDGTYTSATNGGQYSVMAQQYVGTNWVTMGGELTKAGVVTFSATPGTTAVVRLVAVDKLGRSTAASAQVSVAVSGVMGDDELTDFLQELQSDIDYAVTSADGKNTIYHQAAMPTTGIMNDTWYDTDDGNRMYKHNGTTFVVAPFGTNALSDLAVTNAKIANLDAAKITTGYLHADRVEANTLGVSKLLVSNLDNHIEDGGFEKTTLSTAWSGIPSQVTRVTTNQRSGSGALRMGITTAAYEAARQRNAIRVEPGQVYRFSLWARREAAGTTPTNAIELSVARGTTESATTTTQALVTTAQETMGTTYMFLTGVWEVPASTFFVRPRIVIRGDVSGTGAYIVDDVEFTRMSDGQLIVDGAITTEKLFAGAVTTNKIASDVGAQLNISSNESIILSVNNHTEVVSNLAAIDAEAAAALEKALKAEREANDALTMAATAESKAGIAESLSETNAGDLRTYKGSVVIDEYGVVIKSATSSHEFRLTSLGAELVHAGSPLSRWAGDRFTTPKITVTEEIDLGNHIIKKGTAVDQTTISPK